jgi:CO/xanthine dehydrogenase FAD-binding subunit
VCRLHASTHAQEDEVRFEYRRPTTLSEALALLADAGPETRPIAYGSDLLVWAKTGARRTSGVVDLTGIEDLRRIDPGESHLFLGAGTTLADVGRAPAVGERFPALASAVASMGSAQLREGASLGGNVCTASPAGDTAPPLLCYGATMVIAGTAGDREVPAEQFYVGPGRTVLGAGELLRGVRLPWPRAGAAGVFLKGARRAAVDLALVSVAAVAWRDEAAPSGIAMTMALGAVAPTPVRAPAAEAVVRAQGLDGDPRTPAGAALVAAVRATARPIDDIRATASYRLELLAQLASRAAADLRRRLQRQGAGSGESER